MAEDIHEPSSEAEPCSICLQPITDRAIPAPCNHHTFDYLCLLTWLQHSTCCPMCKQEITVVNYDFRGPDDIRTYVVPRTTPAPLQFELGRQQVRGFVARGAPGLTRDDRPHPWFDRALEKRKYVYLQLLYSRHIGSNPISGFRNVTPDQIAEDTELQSKARTWIRRELRVFSFLTEPSQQQPVNQEWLLEFIICILRTIDPRDMSDWAHHILTETLGHENARLFLHELSSWMRSPFRYVKDWEDVMDYGRDMERRFMSYVEGPIGNGWPRYDLWPNRSCYRIYVPKR